MLSGRGAVGDPALFLSYFIPPLGPHLNLKASHSRSDLEDQNESSRGYYNDLGASAAE